MELIAQIGKIRNVHTTLVENLKGNTPGVNENTIFHRSAPATTVIFPDCVKHQTFSSNSVIGFSQKN